MENLTQRLEKFTEERTLLRKELTEAKKTLVPLQMRLLQVGKNIENLKTKIRQEERSK